MNIKRYTGEATPKPGGRQATEQTKKLVESLNEAVRTGEWYEIEGSASDPKLITRLRRLGSKLELSVSISRDKERGNIIFRAAERQRTEEVKQFINILAEAADQLANMKTRPSLVEIRDEITRLWPTDGED